MRIGVNCYQLLPDIGGLKQYFLRLFKELLQNDERNTYIFFYFSHNLDELSYLDDLKWQENAIELQDQQGHSQSLAGILESGSAALVFYRSADW